MNAIPFRSLDVEGQDVHIMIVNVEGYLYKITTNALTEMLRVQRLDKYEGAAYAHAVKEAGILLLK